MSSQNNFISQEEQVIQLITINAEIITSGKGVCERAAEFGVNL